MQATLIQGAVNGSAIAASTLNAVGVSLTHNAGGDWTVEEIAISYNGATPLQAGALVQLFDSQRNRFFVTGQISLGIIGFPRSGTAVLSVAPIIWKPIRPLTLSSGQSIQLYVSTDASTAFVANDLCLIGKGFQNV